MGNEEDTCSLLLLDPIIEDEALDLLLANVAVEVQRQEVALLIDCTPMSDQLDKNLQPWLIIQHLASGQPSHTFTSIPDESTLS